MDNTSITYEELKQFNNMLYTLQLLNERGKDFVSNEYLAGNINIPLKEMLCMLELLDESLGFVEIHKVENLIGILQDKLGYNQKNKAVIVGVGNLGMALLKYDNFKTTGLDIIGAFDIDYNLFDMEVSGVKIAPVNHLVSFIKSERANIALLTTPNQAAQDITNKLCDAGIKAIWNFTMAVLKVPDNIIIQNTSIYNDYSVINQKLGFL